MVKIVEGQSRTFSEYLIIPNLTKRENIPSNVSLASHLTSKSGHKISLSTPIVSAAMQAVSGPDLCIELARMGGLGFIFCSQTPASQAEMIRKVKKFKAGFVESDANVSPDTPLSGVKAVQKKTGYSTVMKAQDQCYTYHLGRIGYTLGPQSGFSARSILAPSLLQWRLFPDHS